MMAETLVLMAEAVTQSESLLTGDFRNDLLTGFMVLILSTANSRQHEGDQSDIEGQIQTALLIKCISVTYTEADVRVLSGY